MPVRRLAPRGPHADRRGRRAAAAHRPTCRSSHLAFAAEIVAGGAVPVAEHGVLGGEVAGLEVCRVVDDPHTGAVRLEVGVGAHDRETFQLLHGDRPTVEALTDVVQFVARHRSGARTASAEAARRQPVPASPPARPIPPRRRPSWSLRRRPPLPRANLKDEVPCVAFSAECRRHVGGVHPRRRPRCGAVRVRRARSPTRASGASSPRRHRDVIDIQHRLAALVRIPTHFVGVATVSRHDDPAAGRRSTTSTRCSRPASATRELLADPARCGRRRSGTRT